MLLPLGVAVYNRRNGASIMPPVRRFFFLDCPNAIGMMMPAVEVVQNIGSLFYQVGGFQNTLLLNFSAYFGLEAFFVLLGGVPLIFNHLIVSWK